MTPKEPQSPLLRMRGIAKSYPGVRALAGIDLDLRGGEVVAVVGENGAGKSTLIRALGGAILPDSGTIEVEGRVLRPGDPQASSAAGIAIIYQEFNLVPELTVRDNLFLGQERTRAGFLRFDDERSRARELFERLGVTLDLEARVRDLSVASQQLVEIARALLVQARVLVLDEPTAALPPHEVDVLLERVEELRRRGLGVLYISHRLEEIYRIADRVLVLRDGEAVALRSREDLAREELIELMVGRRLEQEFPPRTSRAGPVRLRVRDLERLPRVRGVSFEARAGEILALAGLVGSGRTETVRLLCGADRAQGGSIELDGRSLTIRHPREAIRAGICLLSEDRKSEGLVLGRSVLENFGLPNLPALTRLGFLRARAERDAFARYVSRLRIKVPHPGQLARNLSGGNQQKVVLAKWLEGDSEVIVFDEPTRGIDVGAKYEIYRLMDELAGAGKVVIMVSSELPEVLGMADRVIVLGEGRVAGEIADPRSATQEDVLRLAVGAA